MGKSRRAPARDTSDTADARSAADAFAELFPAIYLRFNRRDAKQSELTAASRAVLTHLSMSGPITVGEAAQHLDRAQSVVSEIFEQLEAKGFVSRMKDDGDRRRVLVWLTDSGVELLERDRDVLSRELLTTAMTAMSTQEREALLRGARALCASKATPPTSHPTTHHNIRRSKNP